MPQRIHLRKDEVNAEHTRYTLFMNGANCGTLCVRTRDEATTLEHVLQHGTQRLPVLLTLSARQGVEP